MLTKEDYQQITNIVAAIITKAVNENEQHLKKDMQSMEHTLREEMQGVKHTLRDEVQATEKRLIQKMDTMQTDILDATNSFFEEIAHRLDSHEQRIQPLEKHILA